MAPRPRLYVEHGLAAGQTVPLARDQAHYLFGVMRRQEGDAAELFNGRDGTWLASVEHAARRGGSLRCEAQIARQRNPPDVWLLFAPLKKARTDFIVEKAAEMGAARICPVRTAFTNAERIRRDRLKAHAIEAAEQCGGNYVPEVAEIAALPEVLDRWPEGRRLIFCDEAQAGPVSDLGDPEPELDGGWAILIGPEGGFSDGERARLAAHPAARSVSLGPRILRADTASVAALALWQQAFGDWR